MSTLDKAVIVSRDGHDAGMVFGNRYRGFCRPTGNRRRHFGLSNPHPYHRLEFLCDGTPSADHLVGSPDASRGNMGKMGRATLDLGAELAGRIPRKPVRLSYIPNLL